MPSTPIPRSAAVDIARALAVIGVVFSHSIDGLVNAQLIEQDAPIVVCNEVLYLLRMPALAFVLGVFIPRGVEKRGSVRYVIQRAVSMGWVFVLWTLLQGGIQVVLSPFTNTSMQWTDVLRFWEPMAQLWFLPFLIAATALVVIFHPWGRHSWWRLVLLGAACVPLWGSTMNIAGARGIALTFFVGLGAAIGLRRLAEWMESSLLIIMGAGLGGAGLLISGWIVGAIPATVHAPASLLTQVLSLATAFGGVLVLLSVSAIIARVPGRTSWLSAIGEQTMAIYLSHILVTAGLRIILSRFGVPGEVILVLGCVTATGFGWIIGAHRSRLRISFLFDFPWSDRVFTARLGKALHVPER